MASISAYDHWADIMVCHATYPQKWIFAERLSLGDFNPIS